MDVQCVLHTYLKPSFGVLRKCQQLSDTDLFSDNNDSPEGPQKQLDLKCQMDSSKLQK